MTMIRAKNGIELSYIAKN